MISDTLFDAVAEIRRYLDDPRYAGVYEAPVRQWIERVANDMDGLRDFLDRGPTSARRKGRSGL